MADVEAAGPGQAIDIDVSVDVANGRAARLRQGDRQPPRVAARVRLPLGLAAE